MNLLDAVLIAIATFFTVRGVLRGLVLEVASLAGILVGFLVASSGYELLAPWVMRTAHLGEGAARFTAFVLLLATTVLLLHGTARLLRGLLRLVSLGWLDRLAGGAIGFAKAGVLACVAVLLITAFVPPHTDFIATSRLVPLVNRANEAALQHLVPEDLRRRFEAGKSALERLRKLPQALEEMLHGS
ncbi:MAG: rane protein required for colicin production [Desulfomicrobiaceae bacterium]|jgi:membrane protein required for colicin V production|nr:rane protein required for colicin production [Desulfomicrobiaceae bacterium]MDK2872869.1 rane protein required for colicin production [Desulfomicrobiaceae bacterium]